MGYVGQQRDRELLKLTINEAPQAEPNPPLVPVMCHLLQGTPSSPPPPTAKEGEVSMPGGRLHVKPKLNPHIYRK